MKLDKVSKFTSSPFISSFSEVVTAAGTTPQKMKYNTIRVEVNEMPLPLTLKAKKEILAKMSKAKTIRSNVTSHLK